MSLASRAGTGAETRSQGRERLGKGLNEEGTRKRYTPAPRIEDLI